MVVWSRVQSMKEREGVIRGCVSKSRREREGNGSESERETLR
jgi:hypothetical protein